MLPDDWHRSTLGEVAKFLSGNTPSKENAAYWVGDFPWITARDMKTLWLKDAKLGLSETGRAVAAIAPPQSILVLTRGMTLLKDLPVCLIERKMAFNQDIKALVPNTTVDATFLAYQLLANKNEILDLVDTAGHGTGRLDTDLLKCSVVVVPPLPEQRRIARVLSTWDQAIATTERLLANCRKQKQALVTRLLAPQAGWSRSTFDQIFAVANQKETQVVASEYHSTGRIPIIDQGQTRIAGYTNNDSFLVQPPVIVFGDHTRVVKWIDFIFRPGADGTQLLRAAAGVHPKFAFHLLANAPIPKPDKPEPKR